MHKIQNERAVMLDARYSILATAETDSVCDCDLCGIVTPLNWKYQTEANAANSATLSVFDNWMVDGMDQTLNRLPIAHQRVEEDCVARTRRSRLHFFGHDQAGPHSFKRGEDSPSETHSETS